MLQLNRIISSVDMITNTAGPPPRPSLASIERGYQVAEDARAMWSPKLLGKIPVGALGGSRNMTVTEGRILDQLTLDKGLMGLWQFNEIANDAFATADRRSPRAESMPPAIARTMARFTPAQRQDAIQDWPGNDGHNDAFRHAYWNARLTVQFGEAWTATFTTAHEGGNPGAASTREAMDLYNNEVGRRIAMNNPDASPAQLADLVRRALDRGDLVVVDRNGHLNWSDRVAVGNHGITISLRGVRDAIALPNPATSVR